MLNAGQAMLRFYKTVGFHGFWLSLLMGIVVWVLRVDRHGLTMPFSYNGDALFYAMTAKAMLLNTRWYLIEDLGWPFGLNLADVPDWDLWQLMGMGVLGRVFENPFIVLNAWYLLTFPMMYASTTFSLRSIGISAWPAAAAACIYALLPYHFIRGVDHLYLSGYMAVPFILPVLSWIFAGEDTPTHPAGRLPAWAIVAMTAMVSTSLYYNFFATALVTAFLLIWGWPYWKSKAMKRGAWVLATLACGAVVSLHPYFLNLIERGVNDQVSSRAFVDTQTWALSLTRMLMPVSGHRLEIFSNLKTHFLSGGMAADESDSVSLGLLMGLGFLILIIGMFRRKEVPDRTVLMLQRANVMMILLFTIGGIGLMFSFFVTPNFRAQNRAVVFIALFSIAMLALLFDRIKPFENGRKWPLKVAVLLLLVLFAAWDQTTASMKLRTIMTHMRYGADLDFVTKLEERYRPGEFEKIRLFQLPYMIFPESPPIHRMRDYAHLRPWLLSDRIQTSYPNIANRRNAFWSDHVSTLSPVELMAACAGKGYTGIWVDLFGYPSGGGAIVQGFQGLVPSGTMFSEDRRFMFVDLSKHSNYNQGGGFAVPSLGGESVSFKSNGQGYHYMGWGWHRPEIDFSWMQGHRSQLKFRLEKGFLPDRTLLNVKVDLVFPKAFEPRKLEVVVGETHLYFGIKGSTNIRIPLHPSAVDSQGIVNLTFLHPWANSPKRLRYSRDGRSLSLAVSSMHLEKVD